MWAGFVLSWLWHILSWFNGWVIEAMAKKSESRKDDAATDLTLYWNMVCIGQIGLSGIAIAAFGYLLFP